MRAMVALTELPLTSIEQPKWHAAAVILCEAFARDKTVWAHVSLGGHADLAPLIANEHRPARERTLLGFAQGLIDDGDTYVPVAQLCALGEDDLRLVIDAVAIASGRILPID